MTFTPIAKNFIVYCRLIYMLSMLYVRLTIKVKVGLPESFKVGWYRHKITGSSHLKIKNCHGCFEINLMFRTSEHSFFPACHALKTRFELSRVKLYRNDLKGNKDFLELAGGSSYRGSNYIKRKSKGNRLWFELARVRVMGSQLYLHHSLAQLLIFFLFRFV